MPPPDDLAATGPICLRAGAATSAGNRRSRNEDAFALDPHCCVVADGIGGHAAGEVASSLAVSTILDALSEGLPSRTAAGVMRAVIAANQAIRERAVTDATAGMGTTVVVAAAVDGGVAIVHVGDSRCYRLHDGVLTLVTRDHSLVQELVDAGRLPPSEAARHPMSNVVTRALGTEPHVEPELTMLPAIGGRLLLCSDGLSDELPPRTVGRVLAGVEDPQVAAERLIAIALAGPARDNVTAVVIDVQTTHHPTHLSNDPSNRLTHHQTMQQQGS